MHVPNKRAKKPQGAPKRAISSFLSFSQLMRPEIRLQYPNLKNTDLSSILAQKWHEASVEAKRPHIERELRDREKYHEDMAHWKDCESERIESEKSSVAALIERGKTGSPTQLSYLNQHPSSSLWAAMIDVNGTSSFDNGPTGPPLYDEAMVGFWDTEMEGGDNQFGCSTGSEESSEKGEKTVPKGGRFVHSVSKPSLFHLGVADKVIARETPLTTAKKSKEERLAKRAKGLKSRLPSTSVQLPFTSQVANTVDLPLTAQQLEIQQRRLQQQHQYQMYQQHLLKQKAKQEVQELQYNHPANNGLGQGQGKDRISDNRPIAKQMLSAGNIMQSGRLHTQSQASQRSEMENPQYQLRKQDSYQGIQRNHLPSTMMLPWPQELMSYPGIMDQVPPVQKPHPGVQRASTYGQPIPPYGMDPYYNTLPYPAAGYGYGLIDGIERYFFDAPSTPQSQSLPLPVHDVSTYPGQRQIPSEVSVPSLLVHQKSSIPPNIPFGKNGRDSMILNNKDSSMRSLQFDEQDRFCVMQTLMAVHRASASKVGDNESIRSLDRIQLGQEGQGREQGRDQGREHGLGLDRSDFGTGSGTGIGIIHGSPNALILNRNSTKGDSENSTNQRLSNSSILSAVKSDRKADKSRSNYCAPLSLQQQERQNQTERQQLKDRQMKQMQDMLLLQEREQAMQKQEHSTSMVTAGVDRSTTSISPIENSPIKFSTSDDHSESCEEDSEEASIPDDSASSCPESEL